MDKVSFMRACAQGGAGLEYSLRELDHAFAPVLTRECVRAVGDQASAQDIVQETLIKAWRHCASYRGDAELISWVRTILKRTIIDHHRRHAREQVLAPELVTSLADANGGAPADEPDHAARSAELQACFERNWRRFQRECPEHAAVMTWIVDEGLSNTEVAGLLERSPGATREFISQCRKRARIYLAEWHAMVHGVEQEWDD